VAILANDGILFSQSALKGKHYGMPVDTGSMKVLVVNDGGRIHALSGVCTHLGCTLEPDAQTGRIACPCHRSSFSLAGQVVDHQLAQPPAALPAVESRVREGQIEVFVV